MTQKTTTIQDVARAAGVSTATVSRALSNPKLLSDRARDAVLEAIRETGYRVNQSARNLRKQRAGAILVLVPNLGNPFFSQILSGISEGFADSDYANGSFFDKYTDRDWLPGALICPASQISNAVLHEMAGKRPRRLQSQ